MLSGACGIAYETLYSLMLSTYFGNIFYIQAAILTTFLLSIGVGSLIAYKFVKYIWVIELGIGLYALLIVFLFGKENWIITFISNLNYQVPIILTLAVVLILIIPATLIGFSIPIMTLYLREYLKKNKQNSFNHVYLAYNISAGLCILLIEFIILRRFGITLAVIFIALINFLISYILKNKIKIPKIETKDRIISKNFYKGYRNNKLVALFFISLASGMFQLIFLKIINIIFGPLNENFSIMLVVVLLGMGAGSFLSRKLNIKYSDYLFFTAMIVLATFLLVLPMIYFWAFSQETFAIEMGISLLVKLSLVFVFGILSFTLLGSSIPFLNQKTKEEFRPGELLAVSSFGNCFGFLIITFFLFEKLNLYFLPILASLLILISGIVYSKSFLSISRIYWLFLFSFLSLLLLYSWPSNLLKVGYRQFNSVESINYFKENFKNVITYKKFDNDVSIIKLKDDSRWLTLNGYLTLAFNPSNDLTTLRETILGISPALFSKNQKNSLIIGLGSGVTAGASSQVFSEVKVVDINPAMIEIMEEFKEENYDILNQKNVEIVIQDGIIELFRTKEKHDVIINTLTSPTYYSASKFWTKNVYDQISKKLNPGGVYAAWFDVNIGKKGIQIMAKTLDSSFEDCKFIILNPNYYGVICKNEPIDLGDINEIEWNNEIEEKFKQFSFSEKYELGDFIKKLVIDIDEKHFSDKKIPINNFNCQVLGFKENFDYKDAELKTFFRDVLSDNLNSNNMEERCSAYYYIAGGSVCGAYDLRR